MAVDRDVTREASARISAARWLFNAKVAGHLTQLVTHGY